MLWHRRRGEAHEIRLRIDVSPLWRHVSGTGAVGVLGMPGSARSYVRLRGNQEGHQPAGDRIAAAIVVALSRVVAGCIAEERFSLRLYASGEGRSSCTRARRFGALY